MFDTNDILWGSAPGPGHALRIMVEDETRHANRSWPGFWFFGVILFLFLILIPICVTWDLISPRTFREFTAGPHAISIAVRERQPRRVSRTKRMTPPISREHHVRTVGDN
jgi:hypothetical protein